jgi:hypothetical protein
VITASLASYQRVVGAGGTPTDEEKKFLREEIIKETLKREVDGCLLEPL